MNQIKPTKDATKAIKDVVEATDNLSKEVEKASEATADATKVMAESVDALAKVMDKSKTDYDVVKQFYIDKFNLDPDLVDLTSNYSILLMCASGAGNKSIAKFLDIPEGSVELVLNEVFGFTGWKEDLDINPYKIYKEFHGDRDKWNDVLWSQGRTIVLDSVFNVCETMERIDKRMEDEWV